MWSAVLVGVVILVVNAWNITGYPGLSDDEGTYLAQAWAVRNGSGLAHYTYWYDHPPFGWIQLAGLSWLPPMLLPDALAVAAGRLAMLPVFAVTLGACLRARPADRAEPAGPRCSRWSCSDSLRCR